MRAPAALLLVAACGNAPSTKPLLPPKPVDAAADAPAIVDTMPIPDAGPIVVAHPGVAYAVGYGVMRIEVDGKVTTLSRRDETIFEAAVDTRGHLWTAKEQTVTNYGDTPKIVRLPGDEWIDTLAPASSGGVWLVHDGRLLHISDAMKVEPHELPGDHFTGRIFDAGETVWLAGKSGLWRYTLATHSWSAIDTMAVEHEVVRDARGFVWIDDRAHRTIHGFDGVTHRQLAYPVRVGTDAVIGTLLAAADGTVYVQIVRRQRGQEILALRDGAWLATPVIDKLDLFAVDDAGRFWGAFEHGMRVVGPSNELLADLPNATVPNLVGAYIGVIRVVRGGPTTLPVPGPVKTGTIRGRLVDRDGKPVARQQFDICAVNCGTTRGPQFLIDTDDDGRFAVEHVTITEYGTIHRVGSNAQSGANWLHTDGKFACCLDLRPNGSRDVGTLVLGDEL